MIKPLKKSSYVKLTVILILNSNSKVNFYPYDLRDNNFVFLNS